MLIKVNNTIINVANIVSAHFTPATDKVKGALTIVCVNSVEPTNSLGRILLEGDEAVQVWDVLSMSLARWTGFSRAFGANRIFCYSSWMSIKMDEYQTTVCRS